jgi:probable F420-dependent oxidoreductase
MKIGLIGFNIGTREGTDVVEVAQAAEAAGVESLWTFEHVMVPLEYQSKYPYTADGKMAVRPETVMIDPLIGLAAVAAATKTIRLGTGVNILPQSNPLFLAKQAASLDFISSGRLMLGLGIGWLEEEFDAMGVPWKARGRRHDDYIEAMRKVWSGDVVEHESEFLSWHGFKCHPLPVQNPLPIVVGGSKGKAFERIAKYGQGWYAPTANVAELEGMMITLQDTCRRFDRDPAEIEVSTMWVPQPEDGLIDAYAEVGVDRLVVPMAALAGMGKTAADQVKRFGDEVMSKFG